MEGEYITTTLVIYVDDFPKTERITIIIDGIEYKFLIDEFKSILKWSSLDDYSWMKDPKGRE